MIVSTNNTINASASAAWQAIANEFAEIHHWAGFISSSGPEGSATIDGLPYAARTIVTQSGSSTHTLTAFDASNHQLTYAVTASAPPFAKQVSATWSIASESPNACTVTIEINLDPMEGIPAEKLEGARQWLSESSAELLEELQHYVETGHPHPRALASSTANQH